TGEGGVLRVGFVGSATHAILPNILSQFRQRYPAVQLVLREATSIRIMQELAGESLDIGVVRVPVSTDFFMRLLALQTEDFVLALPKSHHLAQRPTLMLKDLSEEDFILYTASDAAGLRMAAIHACQLAGFTPRVAQEAVQVQTVLGLVEVGLGVALVPSVSRRFTSKQLVYKTLADFPASASIGISLAWNPLTDIAAIQKFRDVAA